MLSIKQTASRATAGGPVVLRQKSGAVGAGIRDGLQCAVLPWGTNIAGLPQPFSTYRSGPNGIAFATTNAGAIYNGGDTTFFVVAHLNGVAPDAVAIGRGRYNNSINSANWLRFNGSTLEHNRSYSSDARWEWASVTGAVTTGLNSYAVTSNGAAALGSGGATLFKNGSALTTSTSSGGTAVGGNAYDTSIDVGKGTAPGATAVTGAIDGQILVGYFWGRVLSAAEIAALHQSPYLPLAPRRIWVPATAIAGGGTALQGVGTSAATGQATLTVTSQLTGTGTTPVTGSGTLSVQAALASQASSTAAGQATLTVQAQLTGTGNTQATGQGTLTTGGSGAALQSSASTSASGRATLTVRAQLQTLLAIAQAQASATLTVRCVLAGTAVALSSGVGTLSAAGQSASVAAMTASRAARSQEVAARPSQRSASRRPVQ